MNDLRKAAEMALDALTVSHPMANTYNSLDKHSEAMSALRTALAQPANQSDCGHKEYRLFCQMCMATKQKPEQEPVAWLVSDAQGRYATIRDPAQYGEEVYEPLYAAPVSKPWVSLTDEEADILIMLHAPPIHPDFNDDDDFIELVNAIEAKLKEKNA